MKTLVNDILKYLLAVALSLICALIFIRSTFPPPPQGFTFQTLFVNPDPMCVSIVALVASFVVTGLLIAFSSISHMKFLEERRVNRVLKKKDEIKTKFLAFAAHNLRTPATALRWSLNDFIKNELDKLTKEQQDSVRAVYSVSLTMLNLIEDFLDISKLELQKFEISLQPTTLKQVKEKVLTIAEEFSPIAHEKHIEISTSFSINEAALIHVDMAHITRVMENITENALNYTLENGSVMISLSNNKENMTFTVKDTGIGIPKKEHPMIFGEFFRSSNAKKHKSTGSGIGLYLARKLIEAHNGKIQFTSIEGTGSTFTFTIPMVPENEKQVVDVFKRI